MFQYVLPGMGSLLIGVAAVIAGSQTKDFVQWQVHRRTEHFVAGPVWRVNRGAIGEWRKEGLDDSSWPRAVAATHTVPLPDRVISSMWISPDTDAHELTFRRTVQFPDRDRIERVTLLTGANDDHRVFMNGISVVSDRDSSAGPILFTDVTPFAKTGANQIAIEVQDYGGGGWLIADIKLLRK